MSGEDWRRNGEQKRKQAGRWKTGCLGKPWYGLYFPRLSQLDLPVPFLFFHPSWTMQGGLETDEETEAQRSPDLGYKVRKLPKRPKVSCLPTPWYHLGSRTPTDGSYGVPNTFSL